MRVVRPSLLVAALLALVLSGVGPAAATTYAPLNQRGPALSVPAGQLKASLTCSGSMRNLHRDPVLLVPGTTMNPQVNFSWNYERAFTRMGWTWCAVTLPYDATGDIQVAGEYVVNALRTMSSAAHRKVDVVGWSQGGMVPRWALRFWPDTRAMVGDLVGLSASNHGTLDSRLSCSPGSSCTPSFWQQAAGSHFLDALNSRAETFAGVDYTNAYTATDEIVTPNAGPTPSSGLYTGDGRIANVSLQSICPGHVADHFAIGSYDAVGYAIVLDALTHAGPASPARIPTAVCAEPFQPGVNPATFATDYANFLAYAVNPAGDAAKVTAEPPLKRYVYARG